MLWGLNLGLAVAALVEEVGVGQVASGGALGALAVEDEAQGVHEGGFAATVEAANEDDGLADVSSQIEGLLS